MVIMFRETPKVGMSHMAPKKDMGIPRETQKATRNCRKRAKSTTTKTRPVAPFLLSRLRRLLK
jgi:hypothetical protein